MHDGNICTDLAAAIIIIIIRRIFTLFFQNPENILLLFQLNWFPQN